jgi:hypothetical protein
MADVAKYSLEIKPAAGKVTREGDWEKVATRQTERAMDKAANEPYNKAVVRR